MSDARPTLGFPTRRAAVVSLHHAGLKPEGIAERAGTSTGTVRVLLCREGLLPQRPAPVRRARIKSVDLNDDVLRKLRHHAARRQMQAQTLALLLIEAVVDGNLVDAVLDDREA